MEREFRGISHKLSCFIVGVFTGLLGLWCYYKINTTIAKVGLVVLVFLIPIGLASMSIISVISLVIPCVFVGFACLILGMLIGEPKWRIDAEMKERTGGRQ